MTALGLIINILRDLV